MGVLNSTVGAGDMKMQDLSEALGTGVLASAKIASLSLKQLGGALATLGDNNIRGADAGTLMKSTIRVMANSSSAGMKVLGTIGIGQSQLAEDMKKGGLIKAFIDLKAHMAGLNPVQQGLLLTRAFGGRQATGVQILLTQMDRLKQKTKQVGDGAGSFGADWKATTKTVSFQIDQIKAGMQALADKIGGKLLPVVSSILGWMLKNKRTMKDLGETVLAAGAAYAIFKTAMMTGATATAIATFATGGWADAFWALNAAMAANPIGLVIAAVALLAAGFIYAYHHSTRFRHAMQDLWQGIKTGAQDAIKFVIGVINTLIRAYNTASKFISNITGGVLGGGHHDLINYNPTFADPSHRSDPSHAAALAKSRNALHAGLRSAHPVGSGVVTHHVVITTPVQLILDGRVAAETVARHNLQLAARR